MRGEVVHHWHHGVVDGYGGSLGRAGEAAFAHDGWNRLKWKLKVVEIATRHTSAEVWRRTRAERFEGLEEIVEGATVLG
jgi:hypothetical protein